jgi:hypothetical protein
MTPAGPRMHRYRRLLLIDRLIPFLAALVALVAMAGMISVELNSRAARAELADQLADLKASMGQGAAAQPANAAPSSDVEAKLSALADRIAGVEGNVETLQTAASTPAGLSPDTALTSAPAGAAAPADTQTAAIDPSLPTTDCIPLGTRFIVTPGETYPLCQSKSVIKVGTITADTVEVQGAGAIVKTGFATLVGTKCTVMVFSADPSGFGELRVTCA